MKNQTYIACYKKKATDTDGYLFLQSKGRKNRAKKALGIRVAYDKFIRYWNDKEQRFKSGMPQYKLLNEKIEKVFEESIKETGKLIEKNKSNKQSFLKYWDRQIELIPNQGSKGKHVVVKKKLETYLQSIKKTDINFADLTPEFIADLHYQFKTDRALTTSSVNSYMKLINNIVRRKTKEDPYTFPVNPFATIKYERKTQPQRKVLTEKELKSLLTTKIDDPELELVRDMYAFQIFASGMRVSDLCLLRWNTINFDTKPFNIKDIEVEVSEPELDYVMYKTRTPVNTPFTYYLCKALLKVVGEHKKWEALNDPDYIYTRQWEKEKRMKLSVAERELNNHILNKSEPNTTIYKGYVIKQDDKQAIELIDLILEAKIDNITQITQWTAKHISRQKAQTPTDFVFPILKNEDFKDISDNDLAFKDVVSKSEELHHKLEYGKKIFRRKLDKVGELCNIKDIMPHAARHTFTQLMINAGASTHNIMEELGHTTLNVTDSYIRHKKFKNKYGENFLGKVGNTTDYLE